MKIATHVSPWFMLAISLPGLIGLAALDLSVLSIAIDSTDGTDSSRKALIWIGAFIAHVASILSFVVFAWLFYALQRTDITDDGIRKPGIRRDTSIKWRDVTRARIRKQSNQRFLDVEAPGARISLSLLFLNDTDGAIRSISQRLPEGVELEEWHLRLGRLRRG